MRVHLGQRIGQRNGLRLRGEAAFEQRIGHAFIPAAVGEETAQPRHTMMRPVGI